MLKNVILSLAIIFALAILFLSCSDDNSPNAPVNKYPYVRINLPDSLEFGLGAEIRIFADASDEDGNISEVEFFVNSSSVKSMTESPYFYDFNTTEFGAGDHIIKVIATDDSGDESESEITLIVSAGNKITMISPLGGEIWGFGTTGTVLWADNISENVKIDLYKGSVLNLSLTNSIESTGSYKWAVPDSMESGTDYKVRITSINNGALYDESDSAFSIIEIPLIKIITPDSSTLWNAGTTRNIIWDDNISENVKIDLYKGLALSMTIVNSTGSTGFYEWTIPDSIESGTDYKIRITSVDDSNVYGEQIGTFKLNEYPSLTVVSPSSYEIWNAGATRTIKWNFNFVGSVKIELYKNNVYYKTIADSTINTGAYNWFIPADTPLAEDYKIKITDKEISTVSDMSDVMFKISKPVVSIYDPPSEIVSSIFKVQWYGNSNDSTNLSYYYCVTTDTTLTNQAAMTVLNSSLWKTTQYNYANVSFTMSAYNSSTVFIDSTTSYTKIVYSKFFVYGIDVYGSVSEVKSKVFGRVNQIPKYPMVYSEKLGINGFSQYWFTVGPDSSQIILPAATEYWEPIDFKWTGDDPDGDESKLEFKWELWERTAKKGEVLVTQSAGWSVNNLSKSFDDEIYNWNDQGKYAFKVYVRDDAFEQSLNHATVNFEVFAPTFDKGILFIDDTDPTLTESPSYLYYQGNPVASDVGTMYRSFLEDAGFTENNTDPLKDYDIVKFQIVTELVRIDTTWVITGTDTTFYIDNVYVNKYSPDLETMLKYRMIVTASEDRSNENGIDFNGTDDNPGYSEYLGNYLEVGGKAFIIGHSALMKTQPYRMAVNDYSDPVRQIFDPYAVSTTDIADVTLNFFRDYFGIYAMTFPETKTWFSQGLWNVRPSSVPIDYFLQDNYDFIGITKYDSITDITVAGIKVDSTKVNDSWIDFLQQVGPNFYLIPLSLKDNGTVLTGIPTIEAFKGEPVYKYKSVYDLPVVGGDPDTVYDTDANGTVYHSLRYIDPVLTDGDNSGVVTRKTGSVATRYVADGDQYRTAFFAFPLYYMNNTNGEVSDMFNAMIDWFDLEKDPTVGWK